MLIYNANVEGRLCSIEINGGKITEISENGSLANTDAKVGDIITNLDGTDITNFNQIYFILEKHKPGDKVKLTLYRANTNDSSRGQTITVTATLTADKGESQK